MRDSMSSILQGLYGPGTEPPEDARRAAVNFDTRRQVLSLSHTTPMQRAAFEAEELQLFNRFSKQRTAAALALSQGGEVDPSGQAVPLPPANAEEFGRLLRVTLFGSEVKGSPEQERAIEQMVEQYKVREKARESASKARRAQALQTAAEIGRVSASLGRVCPSGRALVLSSSTSYAVPVSPQRTEGGQPAQPDGQLTPAVCPLS